MKLLLALVLSTYVFVLGLPVVAIAQTEPEEVVTTQTEEELSPGQTRRQEVQDLRRQLLEERKAELTQAREERILARCERLKSNIGQIAERLENVEEARGNLLDNLADRLERFNERLLAAGLDTTALQGDIAQVETYAEEVRALWDSYQQELAALQTVECSEEASPFHDALEVAKEGMAEIRAKYREVITFMTTDVKETLQDLRAQLETEEATEAETESEQPESTEPGEAEPTEPSTN